MKNKEPERIQSLLKKRKKIDYSTITIKVLWYFGGIYVMIKDKIDSPDQFHHIYTDLVLKIQWVKGKDY